MPPSNPTEPWPRLRDVVEASVTGLHRGRFIEETLEALCVQLGAASAWSTLETKGSGPMHRSRTTSFRGVAPAILAMHVTDVLGQVQTKLKTVAGSVPYAPDGSFIATPLWSQPTPSSKGRSLVGALYLEFAKDQGKNEAVVGVVETVGTLLGASSRNRRSSRTPKRTCAPSAPRHTVVNSSHSMSFWNPRACPPSVTSFALPSGATSRL